MIPARHNKAAQALFHLYVMPAMRRQFHSIHLLGDEPEWPRDRLLLILPNHCSWWDGFFIHLVNIRLWQRKVYLMMLENQLAKHRFFSRLGAFSIDPESPGGIRQSLRYTREILSAGPAGERMLCIFPQGELLPWQIRPLSYKPGLLWLLQRCETPVCLVQMGIKMEFLLQQRPQAFIEFAEPLIYSGQEMTLLAWEERHAALLDRMGQRILAGQEGRILLQGRGSVNTRWLRWRRLIRRSKP
jgi:chlorobactene lauroyltransferase